MSAAAAAAAPAAPAAVKRKKTNKISQQTVQPPDKAGLRDDPPGMERSSSSCSTAPSVGGGAWAAAAPPDPHDEVPIGKTGPMSFEELLERELARDQASQRAPPQPSKSASKATFLKRGSGAVAALAKSKGDGDKRNSLSDSGEGSQSRQPLADIGRTNGKTTASADTWCTEARDAKSLPRQTDCAGIDRSEVAQRTQITANDPDPFPGGRGAHGRQYAKRETGRTVARKLDVEGAEISSGMESLMTAAHVPAARATTELGSSATELGSSANRGTVGPLRDRSRHLQQLNPDEEAELIEFESLERKVVFAGADDSIYRDVLNKDMTARDSEDGSEGAGEQLDRHDCMQDEEISDSNSVDHYIYDETEAWDGADRDSEDPQRNDIRGVAAQGNGRHELEYGDAQELPLRSSIVNRLFTKNQPKRQEATPQRKITPARSKDTALAASKVATAAGESLGGSGVNDSPLVNKMAELDKEIKEFRRQNELLDKLRREVDADRERVEEEKRDLSQNLVEAEERFERYKEAELKKMKKERRDIDKQLQLAQAQVADLRGERDSMRQEMQVLQEDGARREKKLKSEVERLKKKVEDMQQRNEELVRELKFSEEARVAMQDKEHLAALKARLVAKEDACAVPPAKSLCLSPRSQDMLATQIAASAVETQLVADGRMTSNTSGRERDSGDDSSGVSNGNLLARALDTSSSGSKHMDAWAREDSMTASFQVDRTGLITDDTLEIDVAKLHKGSSASREEPQQSKSDPAAKVVSEKHHGDGKVERLFADGKKLLIFSNGTRKEVFPGGGSVVHFSNQDVKHTFADGKVVYYYAETRTTHTTQPDGLEMFEFSNGQREKHFPDGSKEILFPDGTLKNIRINKEEESIFPDGTVQRIFIDGTRVIEFTNGLKETISPNGNKVRTFKADPA